MGTYSVVIPGAIAARTTDSFVKTAKYTLSAVENGNILTLGALSSVAGESEVFLSATPATATLATAIYYMVYEPPVPVTNGQFKGLSDDPSDFAIAAGKVFNVFLPRVGDEIIITENGLAGTKSSNTYVVPANGALELTWASSTSGVNLAWELIETTFVNIPNGTFYGGRKTAYKFRCVVAA